MWFFLFATRISIRLPEQQLLSIPKGYPRTEHLYRTRELTIRNCSMINQQYDSSLSGRLNTSARSKKPFICLMLSSVTDLLKANLQNNTKHTHLPFTWIHTDMERPRVFHSKKTIILVFCANILKL